MANAEASEDVRIVAVDLQEMAPIEGVVQLQGDITDAATVRAVLSEFRQGDKLGGKQGPHGQASATQTAY